MSMSMDAHMYLVQCLENVRYLVANKDTKCMMQQMTSPEV